MSIQTSSYKDATVDGIVMMNKLILQALKRTAIKLLKGIGLILSATGIVTPIVLAFYAYPYWAIGATALLAILLVVLDEYEDLRFQKKLEDIRNLYKEEE